MLRVFGRPEEIFPGRRCWVTIGMFDGVHAGHRAVLAATVERARRAGDPAAVLTFDVHPRALCGDGAPPTLTSLEHRLVLFAEAGIDAACVLAFASVAPLPAEEFARRILAGALRASGVVLGHDAHFGRGREGGFDLLRRLGPECGWEALRIEPVRAGGALVSSTAIREAVRAGRLDEAAAMLGRPVSVLGAIVSGRGVGRQLGFPTLNLDLHHEIHPPAGVYVTRCRCGDTLFPSVSSIGPAPGAPEGAPLLVETHLLDFAGDLYGQTVETSFLAALRERRRFQSHEALSRQIALDVEAARVWFRKESRA